MVFWDEELTPTFLWPSALWRQRFNEQHRRCGCLLFTNLLHHLCVVEHRKKTKNLQNAVDPIGGCVRAISTLMLQLALIETKILHNLSINLFSSTGEKAERERYAPSAVRSGLCAGIQNIKSEMVESSRVGSSIRRSWKLTLRFSVRLNVRSPYGFGQHSYRIMLRSASFSTISHSELGT